MMLAAAALVFSCAAPAVPEDALVITDPARLAALEEKGLTAGALAFGAPAARSNDALAPSRGYGDVVATLHADLAELYGNDRAWGVGMRFTHRGFDARWLTSADARWLLAAVVNRVDRRAFHPGTCGELRFVYRLGYTTHTKSGPFSSRLPATLNVVFFLPDEGAGAGCASAARRLALVEKGGLVETKGLALKSVELNVQAARWPSTVRPDLGGHADYILRAFTRDGDRLRPAPLENTPDVERIAKQPPLKAELLRWLAEHVEEIDRGTVVVPDRFLATKAVSVTPRGMARRQNRPWTRLFDEDDIATFARPGSRTFRDGRSLLRRLDGLSCVGCHQSRSLAGFHVVGQELGERTGDALAVAVSPHVEDELVRRSAYVDALLAGRPPDELRPPAEHGNDRGGFGDACGLVPSFSSWRCSAGFRCMSVDEGEVGQCMPDAPVVGAACRPGVVQFRNDRIVRATETSCPETSVCEAVPVGFPGGMCAGPCRSGAPAGDGAACGGIAILTPFNQCLAREELFSTCAKHARPAALRACGAGAPCRPDYLCAKNAQGEGVCLPPYFVLQMRVDGHPAPPRSSATR